MTDLLALEDVTFRYPGGTVALERVSLSFPTGQRVAIVGQNGSGKSTLARHLNGLLRPSAGRVLAEGRDAAPRHVAELAAVAAIAFQDPDRQIFSGRVRDEVAFGPRNLGLRGERLEQAVRAALDATGLTDLAEENPYDLGYSRRKLLALASVLAMRTPAVVLDEPTTGQDAAGVGRVRSIVSALADEGRSVIAIIHDMRFVAKTF